MGSETASKRTLWAVKAMLADRASQGAREAGAKLACLAAFDHQAAGPLRDNSLSGDAAMRKGATTVYAANISNRMVGDECRHRLKTLMNDDDQEVRTAVATFLRDMDEPTFRELRALIGEWGLSKSAEDGAEDAARMLEQYPLVDPQLTLDLAKRFTDLMDSPIEDTRARHSILSHYLVPAILNVYHKTTDPALQHRAMDLFERLEEPGCSEVRQALEAVDRM